MSKTIDLHGLTVAEGKKRIEQLVATAPHDSELTVIHGCHKGDALMHMVRKTLKHKRIKRKIMSTNTGITILLID